MKILSRKTDVERFLAGRQMALAEAERVARPILADVKKRGDRAVAAYGRKFDAYDGPIRVPDGDLAACWRGQPAGIRQAIERARHNIAKFARMQMPREWRREVAPGICAGQIVRPLESVGCYVPGGRFPLFSTVLMTVVPARVAGVPNVVVSSPRASEAVRAAAHAVEAAAVFAIGGVQAIAAMAYGTETVPRVDKIVGPGNIYVTAAKKMLAGEVGIDFLAGPTEIVIVAEDGNPEWLAADMLAQAEHDPQAAAILLTPSRTLANAVYACVPEKWKNCTAIITETLEQAFELSNRIAPEHLSLSNPAWIGKVKHAGSVFLGPFSPEAAGDYCAGPNHVLPTVGAARLRGGLSVADFVKVITVQELTPRGLAGIVPTVATLARAEGLENHARSVELRVNREE